MSIQGRARVKVIGADPKSIIEVHDPQDDRSYTDAPIFVGTVRRFGDTHIDGEYRADLISDENEGRFIPVHIVLISGTLTVSS